MERDALSQWTTWNVLDLCEMLRMRRELRNYVLAIVSVFCCLQTKSNMYLFQGKCVYQATIKMKILTVHL